MTMPLVSVYIPTKNRAEMLARAVRSCLAQDHGALEILIVDDGSAPQVAEQNRALANTDPRIRLFSLERSMGASAARNLAIEQARGEFITGLDDDDEFLPGRISAFVQAMAAQPNVSFLCSGYCYILTSGMQITGMRRAKTLSISDLLKNNYAGNQVFTRTSQLRAIGGFDAALQACQDYDVWVRLVDRFGPAQRLGLANYLVHQEHDSPRISQAARRLQGHGQFIEKHQALLAQHHRLQHQLFLQHLLSGSAGYLTLVRLAPVDCLPVLGKTMLLHAAQWLRARFKKPAG